MSGVIPLLLHDTGSDNLVTFLFIESYLFVVVDFKIIPCRICNEQVPSSGNGVDLDSLDVHSDFRPYTSTVLTEVLRGVSQVPRIDVGTLP